jgi:hypothetical protein
MRTRMTAAAMTLGAALAMTSAHQLVGSAQQASTSTSAAPLVVRLSVVASGVPATVSIRNGEMGRWTLRDGDQYGLTPVVSDSHSRLILFRITTEGTAGAERLQQVASLPLLPDKAAAYPAAEPLFIVTLLGTSAIPAGTDPNPGTDGPCSRCCVTCDGITGCGCAVQMDCGSCCCSDHCTCADPAVKSGCLAPSGAGAYFFTRVKVNVPGALPPELLHVSTW